MTEEALNEAQANLSHKQLTEEELNKKIDADLNAIFDVTSIMNLQFDLLRKAYLKGIETGMMMHE